MDHLSSCYFCASALDRPLQTVRLADGTGGDDAAALTLCPPCRRKLERVFEVAGDDGSPRLDVTGSEAGGDEATVDADGLEWGSPGEGTDDSSADAAVDENPDEVLTEVSTDAAADEGGTGESSDVASDDTAAERDGSAETEDTADESGESGGAEDTTDESDEAEEEKSPAESTEDVPSGVESTEDEGTTTEAADDTPGGGESKQRTVLDESGGSSMSALEYNKVIRLLQNREFPVDRDEIVTIAANAYDLRRAECAAILDLAVERDVFAESDGKLYRPE